MSKRRKKQAVICFKVVPYKGKLNAPAIYVQTNKKKEALSEAKSISGLSRFNSWGFSAIPFTMYR